jgi:hypothetical protein
VSHATCVNNCNELGRAARVEAQKLARLMKLGSEMRVQLSKRGKELKQEKKVSDSAHSTVTCSVKFRHLRYYWRLTIIIQEYEC